MNLVLLAADELDGERARLVGRRAAHLREVLGVTAGQTVRAGIERGPMGEAVVTAVSEAAVELRFEPGPAPPERPAVDLVLALPRPKVLVRVIEHAASMGVGRIDLVNAWRVDRAYFDSPRAALGEVEEAARRGCEQGVHTWVPDLAIHRRFTVFLQGLPARDPRVRLAAHPRAGERIDGARDALVRHAGRVAIAIGPEGGWIERELDSFAEHGFRAVTLGRRVLRCEAAVVAALAQLELLTDPIG